MKSNSIGCITDIVYKNGQFVTDPRKGPYCSRLVFVRCVCIGVVGTFRSLIIGHDLNDKFLKFLLNDWNIDIKQFCNLLLSQTASCEANRSKNIHSNKPTHLIR